MKTRIASLIVVFSLITTLSMAQDKVTVEAQSGDISNNLDLKAVATVFGESGNLEEFEKRLNDYDSQISNLDLNNDGQVDYLRVIEKTEKGVHVVVIQAVLAKDVYQDVATIIVEKDQNDNPTVQVVGDPYLYGNNYIIEPAYVYTPSIFSFFWGPGYFAWNSPYYWGYYPTYYHRHNPYELNVYMSNVYTHVNHNQRYYYTNRVRNESAVRLMNSARRNDFAVRYPERSFSNRNVNVRNKRDFEFTRSGVTRQNLSPAYQSNSSGSRPVELNRSGVTRQSVSPTYQSNSSGSRPVRAFNSTTTRTQGYQNTSSPVNSNNNARSYTTPANVQTSTPNRSQNRTYQTQPANNQNVQVRTPNTNNRPTPTVSQPVQVNVQRQQVVRQPAASTPTPRVESAKEGRR